MKINNENRCSLCYENMSSNEIYHNTCLKKLLGSDEPILVDFKEQDIEKLAYEYVSQKKAIPGVQKKLSLTLSKTKHHEQTFNRLTIVGYMGGDYILKPPTRDYPFMPEIEDLTMHMAEIANLDVAQHGLLKMKNQELAYITKRFDRLRNKKIAVEDLCQLSEKLTEDKYRSSHEKIGHIIRAYAKVPGEETLKFFEIVLFCFLVGNGDMHLKNFSLITEDLNNIRLAPNYDLLSTRLLISQSIDREELALPLNGKKSNIRKKDFIEFGTNLNIPLKVIETSINKMLSHFSRWQEKINCSFLNITLKQQYLELIQERANRLT